jgi:hypothetical protein
MDLRRQLDSLQACRGESAPQAGGDHAPKTQPAARLVRGGQTDSTSPEHPDDHPRAPHRRRERGEVTLDEAAAAWSVSPSSVRRLIQDGQLAANQLCKGAPWVIRAADLARDQVKQAASARRLRRPPAGNPLQKALDL